jgi:hypothetical protein
LTKKTEKSGMTYRFSLNYFLPQGDRIPTCFRRQSAPKDIEKRNEINLSACGDRDVVYLSPTDCEQSLGQNDTETGMFRE